MITYICAKDLVRVRSIGSQTAARRIQKVKKEKKLTNTNLVSLADYCEVLGENYIELLALINTNSIVEFVKLYSTLNSAV